jgi:hypothetical protein
MAREPAQLRQLPHFPGEQTVSDTWPRGIILYREQLANDAQFNEALAVPGIDGMAVVLDWSTLEPTRGAFDTATIDTQLSEAQQYHLPVELVIRAGKSVPSWVSPGTQLKLAYATHGGATGNCAPVNMPPPWDSGYQDAFASILKRTTDHVRSKGVTILAIKLTGINATTEEFRLPAEMPDATKDCPGGGINDIAIWQNASYKPAKLVQATRQLATSFATAVPGVPITLAMIPQGAFPPIDDSGHILRGKKRAALNASVLQSLVAGAAQALPGRFILQFDYLNYNQPANAAVVNLARANNLPLAWQTNLWRGGFRQGGQPEGAGCGGSPGKGTVCNDQEYLGLLEEGIHPAGGVGASSQGLYIEVFPYDALHHKSDIAQAHAELMSLARPSPDPAPKCPPGSKCPRPT